MLAFLAGWLPDSAGSNKGRAFAPREGIRASLFALHGGHGRRRKVRDCMLVNSLGIAKAQVVAFTKSCSVVFQYPSGVLAARYFISSGLACNIPGK